MKNQLKRRYLPEFVYGSVDGTVTTFAIVSGAMGASLAPGVVLVLGIANVLADGLSMASGNYLSEQSNRDVGQHLETKQPLHSAATTFGSFVLVGMVPLLPFLLALWLPINNPFLVSIFGTALAFVFIGWLRASVAETGRLVSVAQTLLVGALAAGVSFGVGYLLRNLVNIA